MTQTFFDDLMDSFRIHLESRGLYPRTIDSYVTPTRRFQDWLPHGDEAGLRAVTRPDIERYLASGLRSQRHGDKLSPASIRYHFKGLQAFWKWYSTLEEIPDPMHRMAVPAVPEVRKDIVSVEEVRKVVTYLDGKKAYRDAALISLLMEDGLRISEAIGLTWDDVNLRTGEVTITRSKNHEVRVVPFGARTAQRLDLLKRKRERITSWVFTGKGGAQLTRFGAYSIVRRRFAFHGIQGIGPHDLRHSFATAFMDANPDGEATLQVIGGWRDRTMVQRYSKQGRDRRAIEDFRKKSPTGLL